MCLVRYTFAVVIRQLDKIQLNIATNIAIFTLIIAFILATEEIPMEMHAREMHSWFLHRRPCSLYFTLIRRIIISHIIVVVIILIV